MKWNLDDILKTDDFDKSIESLEKLLVLWEEKWNKITPEVSEEDFIDFINFNEDINDKFSRLAYLPHLMESVDQKDQKARLMNSKVNDLSLKFSDKTRDYNHWLTGRKIENKEILDDKNANRIFSFIKDLEYVFNRQRLAEKYILSEKEEKIINNKDINGINVLSDIRGLIESDFKYKVNINGEKKIIKTQSELMSLVYSDDKNIRKEAYRALLKKHKKHIDKFFVIYQAIVKDWAFEKTERKYKSAISMRNFANDITDKSIETLLEVCKDNKEIFQNYFRYKAKKLGLKKISRFDLYAPIENVGKKIDYEEAKKLVIDSFSNFSEEFSKNAQKIINKKHIDVMPCSNKRSGAFCATVGPKIEPYILLNFTGKNRDVSTLAHELGHGVHSLFANKHYSSSQHANLPLAETASTLGEMLLMDKILSNEKNKNNRKSILAEKMDDAFATILRQCYFIIFEIKAHEAIKKGVTEKELSNMWFETLKEQFGDSVEIDELFKYEWAYISHIFESPFYCYAYNFGELLTYSLYEKYKKDNNFSKNIEKLLEYGGSISPEVALKEIGVDTESKEFWQEGFETIKKWQKELDE